MDAIPQFAASAATTPTRHRDRARYDKATVRAILDEALFCHLGYVVDGRPVVLPTLHVRIDDTLYLHGSSGSRPMVMAAGTGLDVCVTVTLVDGLVLARSAFSHSLNYRSVVAIGTAHLLGDPAEKLRVSQALVEHVLPGRSTDSRRPNAKELAATSMLALDLDEVSAKVRTGDPVDDAGDLGLPHWAGILPLVARAGEPTPAADLDPSIPVPPYVTRHLR